MLWKEFMFSLLVFSILAMSYRVYQIGAVLRDMHESRERERTEMVLKQANPKCRLPCLCRRYYNSGTDEWLDCMMVGYK
jgi:hypothetical protein